MKKHLILPCLVAVAVMALSACSSPTHSTTTTSQETTQPPPVTTTTTDTHTN
jgi:outer membrane protein assembly factor BamE (lipoprotein component of BamABCDE complex)